MFHRVPVCFEIPPPKGKKTQHKRRGVAQKWWRPPKWTQTELGKTENMATSLELSKHGWPQEIGVSFSKKYYHYLNLSTQQLNKHQPTNANALTKFLWGSFPLSWHWLIIALDLLGWRYSESTWLGGGVGRFVEKLGYWRNVGNTVDGRNPKQPPGMYQTL